MNICEVKRCGEIEQILKKGKITIIGLTVNENTREEKIMIRKFLKDKSRVYKNINFIYMNVQQEEYGGLNIIDSSIQSYPQVYHIQYNDILVHVKAADVQALKESFNAVEQYYVDHISYVNDPNDCTNDHAIDQMIEKNKNLESDFSKELENRVSDTVKIKIGSGLALGQ